MPKVGLHERFRATRGVISTRTPLTHIRGNEAKRIGSKTYVLFAPIIAMVEHGKAGRRLNSDAMARSSELSKYEMGIHCIFDLVLNSKSGQLAQGTQ